MGVSLILRATEGVKHPAAADILVPRSSFPTACAPWWHPCTPLQMDEELFEGEVHQRNGEAAATGTAPAPYGSQPPHAFVKAALFVRVF